MIDGYVETQKDKDKKLCQWLRENSSGYYRPSASAATRIEELNNELRLAKELILMHQTNFQCPVCNEVIENGSEHLSICQYYKTDMSARCVEKPQWALG